MAGCSRSAEPVVTGDGWLEKMSGTGPKVLYVIDSLSRSGAEQSLVSMAPHLLSLGIDLEVAYLLERPGLLGELRDSGVVTHTVAAATSRRARITALRELIRSRKPALIHTTLFESDIAGRIAARLAGVPSVSSLVNVAYGYEQRSAQEIRPFRLHAAHAVDRLTARLPVRFHAITQHVALSMGESLSIPPQKICVIPRGRDLARLGAPCDARRSRARQVLGLRPDDLMLLAASRHEYQKGLDVLIDALPIIIGAMPEVTLVVAGREGNATNSLTEKISQLGIGDRVRLLGMRDDVADLITAADLFVLPSRWEGFGGVMLEAMALETPIVASDIPPLREVAADCAWWFSPNDPQSLAETTVRALRDHERAQSRALLAARRVHELFAIDRIAVMMARFYNDAVSRARDPEVVGKA